MTTPEDEHSFELGLPAKAGILFAIGAASVAGLSLAAKRLRQFEKERETPDEDL